MSKYSLPKCDCGAILDTYVEIKLYELQWKIDSNGEWGTELLRDEPIDIEETYLICKECRLKHACEEDEKGRLKRR